jgi:hypothetical protein
MNFKTFSSILFLISAIITINACKPTALANEKVYKDAIADAPYDAIIVPGIPFEKGKWNALMKMRVLWSVHLYKEGLAKNIIYSGSSVYTPFVEAIIMKQYALKLGVPNEHCFTECRAEHSRENVYYGTVLARKHDFKKVAIATDRIQNNAIQRYIRKLNCGLEMLPVQETTVNDMPQDDPSIDTMQAYVANFVSIMDRDSYFKRLKGMRGKNITVNRDSLFVKS